MTAPVDLVPVSSRVLEHLAAKGIRVAVVLERARLDASRFSSAHARITTREFFALWSAVEAEADGMKRRDFGLALGQAALAHGYSVASIAALYAPNLGEALQKLGRYKKLTCPEHVVVDVKRAEASVRFHWILAETQMPRLLVDATFASFVEVARRGTATALAPRRVELARKRSDAPMLASYFECEIKFDAPFDRLIYDEKALAMPFVTYDPRALAEMMPELEAALGERRDRAAQSFRDEVGAAIARRMYGERPSIDKIARDLSTSARTLQRRLGEDRTSYQQVLDDVRKRTARRLLANTELDAVEVAFFLGFEEPNSFVRAFRGWEGTTPIRWRQGEAAAEGAREIG